MLFKLARNACFISVTDQLIQDLIYVLLAADVVTEFIEGLVETYPGLQYLDGFPDVSDYMRKYLILLQ